jgi:hypothetical protein
MSCTSTEEGDGTVAIRVTDPGSRYQLVDERLLRDEYAHLRVLSWLAPLGYRDASLRAFWYVRRDRWTWFFKGLWKVIGWVEDKEGWLLSTLFLIRRKNDDGILLEWKALL